MESTNNLKDKLERNETKLNPVVRTNAYNIPGGSFNVPKAGNKFGWDTPNGPLRNQEDVIVNLRVNPNTASNPYLSQFDANTTQLPNPKPGKKKKLKKQNR